MAVSAQVRPKSLFWPTIGLIFFSLLWASACTAGFWYIYQGVTGRSSDPDIALRALQWTTWPFAMLVVAGPLFTITFLGGLGVIRDLISLRTLFGGLPEQITLMQDTVTRFNTLRAQMLTDLSRANDANTAAETEEAEAKSEGAPPHVQEFWQLYEQAKALFYDGLEDYNARGGEPEIVKRGGANFSEITSKLRDRREFSKSEDANRRTAEFLLRTFELERSTRRHRETLSPDDVASLRSLRARLK